MHHAQSNPEAFVVGGVLHMILVGEVWRGMFAAFAFPGYVASFGMHTGFFTAAVICLVATLFFWNFVPATKGRSLEEIEGLWQSGTGRPYQAA